MTRFPSEAIPRRIIIFAILNLFVGLCFWLVSLIGQVSALQFYFERIGPAVLLLFGVLELSLAVRLIGSYHFDTEMCWAWVLIALSAALRIGGILGIYYLILSQEGRLLAVLISGPLQLVFLGWALALVLRVFARLEYVLRVRPLDWILLALFGAFALWTLSANLFRANTWLLFSDPLLCCVLLEVVLLYRAVSQMKGGLVAACWISYGVAVVLTAVSTVAIAASSYGLTPGSLMPLGYLVLYPAAAAFALGPAFQFEAISAAKRSADVTRSPR